MLKKTWKLFGGCIYNSTSILETPTKDFQIVYEYVATKGFPRFINIYRFQMHDVRVKTGINCGSEHYVVRAKVYLPVRGRTSNTDKHEENYEKFMYPKYNLDSFQHECTQYLYKKRLDEKLTAKEEFNLTEIYGNLIQSLQETAKEVLGEQYKGQSRKVWWTEEIEVFYRKKEKTYIRNG